MSENNRTHDVFDAIADPTRRRLIRLLAEAEELPLHALTPHIQMGRTAVSKHLAILKAAGLVTDRKVGRETRYRLNAGPLEEVQHWLACYSKFWSANLSRLHEILEEDFKPVVGHRFQFRTKPTEFWNGVIEGEVLVVEEPTRLSYTWSSGETHTITWTLQDLGNGMVHLHLEQTGISSEPALNGAKYGWSKWLGELEKVLEQ